MEIITSETNKDIKKIIGLLEKSKNRRKEDSYVVEGLKMVFEIPKEDKETLYGIRRLSIYTGDVYVREPSGLGYWANIEVSYNVKYNSLIVPVTFNIKRVEGGM